MAINLPRLSEAAEKGVRVKLPAKPKDVKVKNNHGKIFHDAMKTAYAMQEKGDKEGTKQALAAAMQNIEAMSMHDKEHYAAEYKAFMALCKKYKVEKPDIKHAMRAKIMEPAGKNMKDVVREAKAKDEIDAREAMSARIEGYFGDLENIHKLSTSDIGKIYKTLVDEKQISPLREAKAYLRDLVEGDDMQRARNAAEAGRGPSRRDVNDQPGFFKKYKEIASNYGWKQRADHMHHPLHGTIEVNRHGEWAHLPHGATTNDDGFGGSNEGNFEKHLKRLQANE